MFVTKKELKALEDRIFDKNKKEVVTNVFDMLYGKYMGFRSAPSTLEGIFENIKTRVEQLERNQYLILKNLNLQVIHDTKDEWALKPIPKPKKTSKRIKKVDYDDEDED